MPINIPNRHLLPARVNLLIDRAEDGRDDALTGAQAVFRGLRNYAWCLSEIARTNSNGSRVVRIPVRYNGAHNWGSEEVVQRRFDEYYAILQGRFARCRWTTRCTVMMEQVILPTLDTWYPSWVAEDVRVTETELDFIREAQTNLWALDEGVRHLVLGRRDLVAYATEIYGRDVLAHAIPMWVEASRQQRQREERRQDRRDRRRRDRHRQAQHDDARRGIIAGVYYPADMLPPSNGVAIIGEPRPVEYIPIADNKGDPVGIECPICYDDICSNTHVKMPCGHDLCAECTNGIKRQENKTIIKCPMCRAHGAPRLQ